MTDVLGVAALVAERARFMQTIVSLTDAEFEHGRTLCAEWAPRDVLAHLIGVSRPIAYVRGGLRVNAVNAAMVRAGRQLGIGVHRPLSAIESPTDYRRAREPHTARTQQGLVTPLA